MGKIKLSGVAGRAAVAPPPWPLSPQQEHIIGFVNNTHLNGTIEAVAGAGKTSTLVEVSKHIAAAGEKAVFLAFNKAIAGEIGAKLGAAGVDSKVVKAATFHSVGFQAWVRHAPASGRNVKGEKLDVLMEKQSTPREYRTFCKKLVSLAKQTLIGCPGFAPIDDDTEWLALVEHFDLLDEIPQGDEEVDEEEFLARGLAWALGLLRASIESAHEVIDFDDMIYMPMYTDLRFWQYDWVMIDEAQDTNAARRAMAHKLLRPGGRLLAVGDPHQAIYGFTGADSDALDRIADEFGTERLPLTVSYRCPRRVVEHAQRWVSHIESAPDAPEGEVSDMMLADFEKLTPVPGSAIICRNTKPIVRLAFNYMKRRVPCSIEGRDIGNGLLTMTRKWKTVNTLSDLRNHLTDFLEAEREKLTRQFKFSKLQTLEDKVSTLLVLIASVGYDASLEELRRVIGVLFADSPPGEAPRKIILSTVHKSKGREWPTVYLLGRNTLMPSPFARQEWQLEQERNLCYVAVTRAQERLVEVALPERA